MSTCVVRAGAVQSNFRERLGAGRSECRQSIRGKRRRSVRREGARDSLAGQGQRISSTEAEEEERVSRRSDRHIGQQHKIRRLTRHQSAQQFVVLFQSTRLHSQRFLCNFIAFDERIVVVVVVGCCVRVFWRDAQQTRELVHTTTNQKKRKHNYQHQVHAYVRYVSQNEFGSTATTELWQTNRRPCC